MLCGLSETLFVFLSDSRADAGRISTVVGNFDKWHWVFAKVFLDLLNIAFFGDLKQFVLLCFIEAVISTGRLEGVEGIRVNAVLFDDVVCRLKIFAGAEVEGGERGEVQGVAVEEVWHGVFLLCCAVGW